MKILLEKTLSGIPNDPDKERIIIKDGTITFQTYNPGWKKYLDVSKMEIESSHHFKGGVYTYFYYETAEHVLYIILNVIDYVKYGESHGKVELHSKITGTAIASSNIKKIG